MNEMGYRKRIKVAVACLCCTVISVNTLAKSKAERLYQLSLADLSKVEITSATGNSTPLDKAPATASVITSEEIEAMGARTLDEALEFVPGLHVSLSALNRLDAVYSIRGIHTGFNPHVLLLMNGVPVQFSLQGGRPALLRLPVTSISKVEVIRGPGSAIYGADAYAGVINVITKDGTTDDNLALGGSAGSFGQRESWVQGSGELGGAQFLFGVTYQYTDGDDTRTLTRDLQTTLDENFGTDASLAPGSLSTGYEIWDTHIALNTKKWKVNGWYWESNNAGIGAGAAQALDRRGHDDSSLWLGDVTYQLMEDAHGWESEARISYLRYKLQAQFNIFPSGTVLPIGADGNANFTSPAGVVAFPDGFIGNPGATTEDTQFDLISIYNAWDSLKLRLAVGSKQQKLDSTETKNFGPGVIDGSEGVVDGALTDVSDTEFVFVKDSSRSIKYLSVQGEWNWVRDWQLTAGIRLDDYSDFGTTINPRFALVWTASEKLTTKFLYGSAFRAPSFTEQFNENNPISLGRDDLDPETIDTYEVSLNATISENVLANLNVFYYEAKDMIEFIPDQGATTSTAQNARNQTGSGFEFESLIDITNNLRLEGNYSWSDVEDKDSGRDVADAPAQQISLKLGWYPTKTILLGLQLNRVEDRKRADMDPRQPVADYTLVDAVVRKDNLFGVMGVKLSVKNIFDSDAREPSSSAISEDYLLEGRSISLSLEYKIK